jgi:hypothetical protein
MLNRIHSPIPQPAGSASAVALLSHRNQLDAIRCETIGDLMSARPIDHSPACSNCANDCESGREP